MANPVREVMRSDSEFAVKDVGVVGCINVKVEQNSGKFRHTSATHLPGQDARCDGPERDARSKEGDLPPSNFQRAGSHARRRSFA